MGGGVGIRAFAGQIGLNTSYLCRIESGRIPLSEAVIDKYAHALIPDEGVAGRTVDEMRLLAGKAPVGMTPEDASLIADAMQRIKTKRSRDLKVNVAVT
jgi:hypothetical protein